MAAGYLRRAADPRDRRRLLLYPTAAGQALEPRIRAARRASEAELAELVGAAGAEQLRAVVVGGVPVDARRQVRVEEQAAAFRREVTRPRVAGNEEGRQPFVVGEIDAHRDAIDLRLIPGDRESDRRI